MIFPSSYSNASFRLARASNRLLQITPPINRNVSSGTHKYPVTNKLRGRQIATSLRTADMKDLEHQQETQSLSTPLIQHPSMSNLFHDVDDFFQKSPFFSPSRHDFMNHFWKQMDIMDDMRRRAYFSNKYFPTYDIHSDDDKVQVQLDLPGVNMSDIDVNIEKDEFLHITGSRKTKTDRDDEKSMTEMKFERRFNFGKDEIDSTNVVANLTNGVLIITLPKLPAAKLSSENVKKIEIVQGADELEC